MAETSSHIFNKRATERLHSPDDLDKYLRMTNPSVWAVLGACAALLTGLLVWGIFGTVAASVKVYGVCQAERSLCLVSADDAKKIHEGDAALVDDVSMTVAAVSHEPISREEAKNLVGGDYLIATLMGEADWAYIVEFAGDTTQLAEGVPLETSITVERIAPITLVLGGGR